MGGAATIQVFGLLAFELILEVSAEYCREGHTCKSPHHCCDATCCLSNEFRDPDRLRWSIWNMWFFLIFILMLCFGGCGYWRRRQILMAQQRSLLALRENREPSMGGQLPLPLFPGLRRHPVSNVYEPHGSFPSPPPYSQVILKEGVDLTDKDFIPSLPPYPGPASNGVNGPASTQITSLLTESSLPPYTPVGVEAPPPYSLPQSGQSDKEQESSGDQPQCSMVTDELSNQHSLSDGLTNQHAVSDGLSTQHAVNGGLSNQHTVIDGLSNQHAVNGGLSNQHMVIDGLSNQHSGCNGIGQQFRPRSSDLQTTEEG